MALNVQVVIAAIDRATAVVDRIQSRLQGLGETRSPYLGALQGRLEAAGQAADDFRQRWGGLMDGMQAAGARLTQVGLAVSGLGAAITGTMIVAAKTAADAGSELNDLAARTGVSVEALSELRYAAEQTGASLPDVELGLRNIARTAVAAASGSGESAEAYARLGVSVRNANGEIKSADVLLTEVGTALRGMSNETERAQLALAVMGRGGTRLLPMMLDAKGGIAALREEARALGLTLSTEDAKALDDLGDSMDRMRSTASRAFVELGITVAPVLQTIVDWLTKAATAVREFADRHPTLTRVLTLSAAAVGALMLALGPLLVILGQILAALPGAALAWTQLTAALQANAVAAGEAAAANTAAATAAAEAGTAATAATAGVAGMGVAVAALTAAVVGLGIEIYFLVQRYREMRDAQKQAEQSTRDLERAKREAEAAGYVTPEQVAREMGITPEQWEAGVDWETSQKIAAEVRRRRALLGPGEMKPGATPEDKAKDARLRAEWHRSKARLLEAEGQKEEADKYYKWAGEWEVYATRLATRDSAQAQLEVEVARMRAQQEEAQRKQQRAMEREAYAAKEQRERTEQAAQYWDLWAQYSTEQATALRGQSPDVAKQWEAYALLARQQAQRIREPNPVAPALREAVWQRQVGNIYIDARGAEPDQVQKAAERAMRNYWREMSYGYAGSY